MEELRELDKPENEMIECPLCLGVGEIYESDDEEGLTGLMVKCNVCKGDGEILAIDSYAPEQNFIDDQADILHDNNF